MQIRRLSEQEGNWLKEFTYHALYVEEGQPPLSRDVLDLPDIAQYYRSFQTGEDVAVGVFDQEVCVGLVWGCYLPSGYGYYREDYIELSLAVLPDYRRQGIGSRLMGAFLEEVRHRQIKGVSLSVSKGNPALDLYAACGFARVTERETDVLMTLALE